MSHMVTDDAPLKMPAGLELTDADKVWWPGEGITKADVMSYYTSIAPVILPYLKDRPMSLHRFNEGIGNEGSFLKNMNRGLIPLWVHTELMNDASGKETISYMVCDDKASLQYMVNLGCISMSPWHSRTGSPDHPDWSVIQLEADEEATGKMIDVALEMKRTCDEAGISCYCKTAGNSSLHLFIPLGSKYTYEQSRDLARKIVQHVSSVLPEITTLEKAKDKKKGKVTIDFMLNARGQVIASPYSILPQPGAPVSTPLEWSEVKHALKPSKLKMTDIPERLEGKGDVWKPVSGKGINLESAMEKIEEMKKKEN